MDEIEENQAKNAVFQNLDPFYTTKKIFLCKITFPTFCELQIGRAAFWK